MYPCSSAPGSKTQKTENKRKNACCSDKDFTKRDQNDLKSFSNLSEEDEDDYETVSSSTLEAIHALRILPPKPLQESEYAEKTQQKVIPNNSDVVGTSVRKDKRCLKPSGTTFQMSSQHSPQPPQHLPKHTCAPEERNMSNVKGEIMKTHGLEQPLLPPRPLKTLPKKYRPIPPERTTSSQVFQTRKTLSQAHTSPTSAKLARHLCFTEENKASGREKATDPRIKLESIFQAQQHKENHLPETSFQHMQSFRDVCSSGSMLNEENASVRKSPSPTQYAPYENKQKQLHIKEETEATTQPTEMDLNNYEWYIGEYSRHEAEAALLEENIDETFLVRDYSKKSNTEPYVLVVYCGRRVYNIKVRFLEDSQQYALGTGLRGDNKFNSVKEIIDFYKSVPITLIDGKDKAGIKREQCYLTYPLKLRK